MSEIDLTKFYNSDLIFSHLTSNKNSLTVFLDDGTKLSGRLLGWDSDYFLFLYGRTLQIVPTRKLARLQAELDNIPADESAPGVETKEISKPKITPAPPEGSDIKDQLMAEKAQNSNKEKPPAQDRLDHLVRNW